MEQLQAYYLLQQNTLAAAHVAVLLADTYPYDAARQQQAARLAQAAGLSREATRLLRDQADPGAGAHDPDQATSSPVNATSGP
jgi:hypothetical protein